MMKSSMTSQPLTVALLLSLVWAIQMPLPPGVQAKPATTSLQFKMPPLPSRGRPIGRYRGGASRGNCPAVTLPLTALVPFTKQPGRIPGEEIASVWGLTTSARPTFWFFTPYANGSTFPAEFVLQNEDGSDVYRTPVALPPQSGVLGVRLPSEVTALQPNTSYRWFFRIYCNQKKTDPPIFVEGLIRRVSLEQPIARQLKTVDPRQKVALYASNGIWYDALTTLADLRFANPQDESLIADWKSLLASIDLANLAAVPLVQ